jgi:hypothetical protein
MEVVMTWFRHTELRRLGRQTGVVLGLLALKVDQTLAFRFLGMLADPLGACFRRSGAVQKGIEESFSFPS